MKQSRIDSIMEAVINTAIGFGVSLLTWIIVSRSYGIAMSWSVNLQITAWSVNLQITAWFTIVSLARQYIIRRMFNGRSVWQAMRGER